MSYYLLYMGNEWVMSLSPLCDVESADSTSPSSRYNLGKEGMPLPTPGWQIFPSTLSSCAPVASVSPQLPASVRYPNTANPMASFASG